jgi:SNF2 family DNA or RNA helicase
MIKVDIADNQFVITGREIEREQIMRINGLRANGAREWRGPLTWPVAVDIAWTAKEQGWEVTPAVREQGAGLQLFAFNLQALQEDDKASSERLGSVDLFPAQVNDALWLATAKKAFIFSEVRSGKTYTLLAALARLEAFPALLTVPTSITFEWERSLKAAFPDKKLTILTKGMTATQRKKALTDYGDIVVVPHNLLPKHSKVLTYGGLSTAQRAKENSSGAYIDKELNSIPFQAVVVDEGHILRNHLSQQTRSLWALGDQATYRYVATATPVASEKGISGVSIEELWPLLRFLYPESFPARSKFLGTYVEMMPNYFGIMEFYGLKPSRKAAWDLIFQPMFIRRTRANQIKQDVRVIEYELNSKQRKIYDQIENESLAEIDGELLFSPSGLTTSLRLSQLCYGTPVIEDNKVKEIIAPSDLTDTVLAWLDESEEKAVIFVDSVSYFNYLEDQIRAQNISYLSWPGGLNDKQKAGLADSFRSGSEKVLLASLRATSVGIDFSSAPRMAFATLSDNFLALDQAAGRNLGPTQKAEQTELAYFIAKDTIQERVYARMQSKAQNIKEVVSW